MAWHKPRSLCQGSNTYVDQYIMGKSLRILFDEFDRAKIVRNLSRRSSWDLKVQGFFFCGETFFFIKKN